MKKKVLISSILTIALCVSLIAGSTFALFTSTSKVNVAVTSGKVELVATVDTNSIELGTTLAGGNLDETSVTFSDTDNTITLDKIVPGDYVNFDIVITNNSDVTVNYRTVINMIEDTGLWSGLVVTIDGVAYNGDFVYSNWETLIPGSADIIVPVTISLPADAGNEYQETSCKLAYTVEAVQGNATVYDGVAKIGEITYDSIAEALVAAVAGDVVEILNPGVYAPFEINTENVTVKGIVGETKLTSTVINVTGDNSIKLYADGAAVDSLWVEVTAGGSHWTAAAFDPYINWNNGTVAENVTINNCYVNGNDKVAMAILYCGDAFTFTNNTVENFDVAVSSMCDGSAPENYVISGNTTTNVDFLVDGYWGAVYAGTTANVTVTDNTATDKTVIRLWDHAITQGKNGNAINVAVTGNTGASLLLTDAKGTTVNTDETDVLYQNTIALTGFNADTYVINTDNFNDNTSVTIGAAGTGTVRLTVGTYKFVGANCVYDITVTKDTYAITAPVTPINYWRDGIIEVNDNGVISYEILNKAGMVSFANAVNNENISFAGKTVKLMTDVDLAGIDWTPIGQTGNAYGDFFGVFDGQNHTIYNLSVDSSNETGAFYSSGLFGWIEGHGSEIIIKNVKVDGANVVGHHNVAVIVGNIQSNGGNVAVENCSVTNANITNTHANDDACGDKTGLIAGYVYGDVTIKNCTASDSTVASGRDAGQLLGASYSVPTNCSATNVTVSAVGDCTGANIANDLTGRKLGSAWG